MDAKSYYDKASELDADGKESEALHFYEEALKGIDSLSLEDQKGLLLGLGSTYRWNERFAESQKTLEEGRKRFPEASEFLIFLSFTEFEQGMVNRATARLLELLLKEAPNASFQAYRRAIQGQIHVLKNTH